MDTHTTEGVDVGVFSGVGLVLFLFRFCDSDGVTGGVSLAGVVSFRRGRLLEPAVKTSSLFDVESVGARRLPIFLISISDKSTLLQQKF